MKIQQGLIHCQVSLEVFQAFLSGKKNSRIIRYNQNPLFVNKNDNFNYRENYIVIIISGCNALLIG